MSKGDRIMVAVRGVEGPFVTEATQNGREVSYDFEKESGLTWLTVRETTRGGTIVQESRYAPDQVVALTKKVKP